MDGLLVVDKPAGPTSHDVVARVRRALGERRIGHTGTLDPAATGILPLVIGRATRLARFLSASDKSYEAAIRLGVSTDTYDGEGAPIGSPYQGAWPSRESIEQALDAFRGGFLQQPPIYSAKKIDGRRSYANARRATRAAGTKGAASALESTEPRTVPAPAAVTTRAIDIAACDGPHVVLHVECSAGFYVRSLAHDLGERLGTGAHLFALRRTRSGDVALEQAVGLDVIERDPACALRSMIPLSRMLPALPSITLTNEGVRHASQGRDLGAADLLDGHIRVDGPWLKLMDEAGDLVALAVPGARPGLLHPSVVLV